QIAAFRDDTGTTGIANILDFVFVGGVIDSTASRFTSASGPVTLKFASVNSASFSGTLDVTVTDLNGAPQPGSGPQRLSTSLTGVGEVTRTHNTLPITG